MLPMMLIMGGKGNNCVTNDVIYRGREDGGHYATSDVLYEGEGRGRGQQ